jgi:dihydrofolate reductase
LEKIYSNIILIAACSSNRVIGKDNQLIWHIPGDLKRFKSLTSGNPILMGRKTFESIGKPLPNRTNIVLTKDPNWKHEGCLVYSDWRQVLPLFENQRLYVIGGGEIYKQLLPYASEIELTIINKEFEGDAYFPEINENNWILTNCTEQSCDEFTYEYRTYFRRDKSFSHKN